MQYSDLLDKYYDPGRQRDLIAALEKLQIIQDLENCLNAFYKSTGKENKIEILSQLVLSTAEYVCIVHHALQKAYYVSIGPDTEKMILEFTLHLARDCYLLSGLAFHDYIDLLYHTTKKTYLKHDWDFNPLEKFLNLNFLKPFMLPELENKNTTTLKISKPTRLFWQGKKQLDLFVDDLTKIFHEVRSKKLLYLLFDFTDPDFKIELSSKNLLPFLSLFHGLHQSGTIKVIGSRGLYVFLNQHLKAPPKDHYPKRDFRKLRHEAGHDENLKTEISRIIKPLLDKYCLFGR